MQYTQHYRSPIGDILLAADDAGLTGLWFEGARYYAQNLAHEHRSGETPYLAEACRWLDIYFSGRAPEFLPVLHMQGTAFQIAVWRELLRIPYGMTTTYGDLAQIVAKTMSRTAMSAQAIGNAVSHNNISIIIPCHRVIGRDGSMVGYAGGMDKKEYLLNLERGQ